MRDHVESRDTRCSWAKYALILGVLGAGSVARGADDRAATKDAVPKDDPAKRARPAIPAGAVEVRLTDDSVVKVIMRDETIELTTRFGKFVIPIVDIQKIDFGRRIPEDVVRQIQRLIAGLGANEFRLRETSSAELLALRDKAYPALLLAAKSTDAEIARRVEKLLEKIRDDVSEDVLSIPDHDVVFTNDGSKIVGRITVEAFKVKSVQFGDLQLKLADARNLRSQAYAEPETKVSAIDDPGTMVGFQGQVGQILTFRVTGGAPGMGGAAVVRNVGGLMVMGGGGNVWGTDVYTLDSSLAIAAVHAGAIKSGQTGIVKVKILGPTAGFQGSVRNGISTSNYGMYNGAYQFEKAGKGQRPPER